jgi:PAS domain S-box-containing protein
MGTQKAKSKKLVEEQVSLDTLSMAVWKTIFDQSPDHIVLLDKDLCILYTNRPSPGLTLDNLIGVPLHTLVEEGRQEEIRKKLARTLKTGRPCSYETQFTTPDGDIIYYESEVVPWKIKNRKVGLILTTRNITDQKKTQNELLRQTEFLDATIDNSPFPMWIAGPDGFMIRSNQALRKTLGFKDAQLIGKYNILHDENIQKQGLLPQVEEVFSKHKTARFTMPWSSAEIHHVKYASVRDLWIEVTIFPIVDEHKNLLNIVCQWVDITEQKENERSLQESEQKYASYIQDTPLLSARFLPDGTLIFVNQAYQDFFGKSSEELIGKTFFDFTPVESHADAQAHLAKLSISEPYDTVENFAIRHDGEKRWIRWTIRAIFDPHGTAVEFQSFGLDITDQITAENEREVLLHNLSDAQRIAHVGSWDWDIITNQETWSDELFRIFGRDPQLGVPPVSEYESQYHPDDLQKVREALNWRTGPDRFTIEFRITRYDDQALRTLRMQGELLHDDDKRTIHFFGIIMDITNQKNSEAALRESRRELETLIGNLPGMAYRCDNDENWTMRYTSQGCQDLTGYAPGDFIENRIISYNEIIHPDDRDLIKLKVKQALEKKQPFELTYRINTAGGAQKWVWEKGSGIFSPKGELISLEGFITDITQRMQAEKELKKYVLLLDTTQQIGKIGGWVFDVPTQVMSWTTETYHIHDIDPVDTNLDFQSSVEASLACYPPQDREKINVLFNACVNQGTPYEYECAFTSTKGRQLWIHTAGHAIRENGQITSVLGYIMDITSQKQAAMALEASETRLRALITNMHAGVAMYEAVEGGSDFIVKDLNLAAERIGAVKREDAVGKSIKTVYPGVVDMGLFKILQDVYQTGKSGELPTAFYEGNNLSIWVENYVYKLPTREVIAIFDDITERKQAEHAVRESEERFRAFMDNFPATAYIKNENLEHIYGNKAALEFAGKSLEEYIGTRTNAIYPEKIAKNLEALDRTVLTEQNAVESEGYYPTPNGDVHWKRDIKFPLIGPNGGKMVGGIALDLTEQKKAQEAIRESEERFRALFSAMNSGLSLFEVMCDDAGDPVNLRFLQVNPTYEQQNNLKAEDVVGKTILEVYPGFDPQWITYYGKVALTGEPFEKEVFNQPENKYFNYKAFSPKKGQVASISTDIHQQKLDQIALEKRKDELERFNRLSVGRELKMIELKKEINQLCHDLGEKPRYRIDFK